MESRLNPGVSVIVPVYNGARYLAEALESALGQTCPPHEVIVVDDGSTDDSARIAAHFQAQFGTALRYCYQENRGTGAARNRGAEIATGTNLAFLDHDDIWLPRKLEFQQEALAIHPEWDGVFGLVDQWRGAPDLAASPPLAGVIPSALLIRHDAFWRVGMFETHWQVGEWVSWYARAMELELGLPVLPEVVARRRLHDRNSGLLYYDARVVYTRILRASLARRRLAPKGEADG
jgi:glycosyltransferase involved in cell wall biosynthesis